MIVGIGTDIVQLARLEAAVGRHGERFLQRYLTTAERQAGTARGRGALPYYAGRWAAKEAAAKALGCGIGGDCGFHDLRVDNAPAGGPELHLHGAAADTAAARGVRRVHLSISHEADYAIAFVVLEG